MVRRVLATLGLGVLAVVVMAATPAEATITGPCRGGATISDDEGGRYRVSAADTKATIPAAGSVAYEGSEGRPKLGSEEGYSGQVVAEVPLADIEVWAWGGESDKTSSDGTESYDFDLPAGLLGGVKGTVTGKHQHGSLTCTGSLEIEIEGSVVNAGSMAAAALTAASGAGLLLAARGVR